MADFKAALVALDGDTVPDWVVLRLAENDVGLVVRDCRTSAELVEVAGDADLVWIFGGGTIVSADTLPELRRCQAILRTGTGTDNVPVAEATAAGIVVATTPGAGTDAVADHAAALIMAVLRQIAVQDRLVRSGVWDRDRAWPHWRLQDQSLGLIGFGAIARRLAAKVRGFDVSIVACDPFVDDTDFPRFGARRGSLDEVLSTAKIVSLHCPLSVETYHLIGEAELRAMRSDAILINTARGPLVDESALFSALTQGWISGAGLDVLEHEPARPDNPLLSLDNVVITPHIAGYSDSFYEDSWKLSVETVIDIARGRWPRSYVNRDVVPLRALSPRLDSDRLPAQSQG